MVSIFPTDYIYSVTVFPPIATNETTPIAPTNPPPRNTVVQSWNFGYLMWSGGGERGHEFGIMDREGEEGKWVALQIVIGRGS